MVRPAVRRRAVEAARTDHGLTERRACALVGMERSSFRYRSRRPDDSELRSRLRWLAGQRPRYGAHRLYVLLRREGRLVNHKRIERLYRLEGLTVRRRRRKRVAAVSREARPLPTGVNERWLMDFTHDATAEGRGFRVGEDRIRERGVAGDGGAEAVPTQGRHHTGVRSSQISRQ